MQKFDIELSSLKNIDTLVLVCRQKKWCIRKVSELKLKKKKIKEKKKKKKKKKK